MILKINSTLMRLAFLVFIVWCTSFKWCSGEEINLNNGNILQGSIVKVEKNKIHFKIAKSGKIKKFKKKSIWSIDGIPVKKYDFTGKGVQEIPEVPVKSIKNEKKAAIPAPSAKAHGSNQPPKILKIPKNYIKSIDGVPIIRESTHRK